MKTNNAGIQLIKEAESCRLNAYMCSAKKWTIGFGATFYADGSPVKMGDSISQETADELLSKHLAHFEKDVLSLVKVPLNENQFAALVSFTFNVGKGNLRKSTLLRKLNEGDYQGAAEEFPRWNKAGGRILNGLIKRRAKEKALFLKV